MKSQSFGFGGRASVAKWRRPVLTEALEQRQLLSAAPGSLDTSFNNTGLATLPSSGPGYFATAIQTDGKILATGYANGATGEDIFVVRYNTNGTLDGTFGTGGKVTTDIGSVDQRGTNVHVQADGKILVMASASQYIENRTSSWIVRYNTNGTIDKTFATNGIYTSPDRLSTFALQGDGKILAVGTTSSATSGAVANGIVDRFTTTGQLDKSFGTNGQTTVSLGTDAATDSALLRDIALTADGGIIVSGQKGVPTNTGDIFGDYLTLKFTSTGKLDPTFGSSKNGIIVTNVSNSDIESQQVLLPNGKILVTGLSNRWLSNVDVSMVRYNANGTLDTTFGSGGKKLVGIYTGGEVEGAGDSQNTVVQSDGKIVASSFLFQSGEFGSTLFRLNSNGTLDTTFGIGGKVDTDSAGFFNAMALQADGKIVQVGYSGATSVTSYTVGRWLGATTVGASITGNVFNDSNGDGSKNAGETNLAGWTVYIDAGKTGSYVATDLATVTDPNGNFTFTNLPAGTYRVRVLPQAGYALTTPVLGYFDITVTAGQQLTGKSFGYAPETVVTGIVFNDLNSSKKQDANEPGLANWRVFLDLNKDGKYEANEPSALTLATGAYTVSNVTPGTYALGEVLQSGWTQTTPSTPFVSITVGGGVAFSAVPIGNHQGAVLPSVSVTALDPTASEEGPSSGLFEFIRTGNLAAALTVNYTIATGTGQAINGADYIKLTGTLTFAAGASKAYLLVTPKGDTLALAKETVRLTLLAGSAYAADTTPATVTIV